MLLAQRKPSRTLLCSLMAGILAVSLALLAAPARADSPSVFPPPVAYGAIPTSPPTAHRTSTQMVPMADGLSVPLNRYAIAHRAPRPGSPMQFLSTTHVGAPAATPTIDTTPPFSPPGTNPRTGLASYFLYPDQVWGGPPDQNASTDGIYAAYMYNAWLDVQETQGTEQLQVAGLYNGAFIQIENMCGFSGFLNCSDPHIQYDRGDSRWVFTYEVFTGNCLEGGTKGGAVALGVSLDSNPLDGFSIYGIGQTATDCYDYPQIGVSSDKVVITVNDDTTSSTRVFVVNKPQLYTLQGFNFDTFQSAVGGQFQTPVGETGYEATTLVEAPDSATGAENLATHYVSGPQGSEVWTNVNWGGFGGLYNYPPEAPEESWTSNNTIATNGNWILSAAYSGNELFTTANVQVPGTDGHQYAGTAFTAFETNANGAPAAVRFYEQFGGNGVHEFYAAVATTINQATVLGTIDYLCTTCGWPSGESFQLEGDGVLSYAGNQIGGTVLVVGRAIRWGDFNGCAYLRNSSPARVVCSTEFSANFGSGDTWWVGGMVMELG